MIRFLFKITFVFLLLCSRQSFCQAPDKWHEAEKNIKRLRPTEFSQLPKSIVKALQVRRCQIPQSPDVPKLHNIIRGKFANPTQNDWAVLCSRNHSSSILIFWNGSTKSVSEIEKSSDLDWLQGSSEGKIGYSRIINPADKKYILDHYRGYGGPKPPLINHEGINVIFSGKASTIRYFHRKKWLRLQGAD